jgi:hypothetical protein
MRSRGPGHPEHRTQWHGRHQQREDAGGTARQVGRPHGVERGRILGQRTAKPRSGIITFFRKGSGAITRTAVTEIAAHSSKIPRQPPHACCRSSPMLSDSRASIRSRSASHCSGMRVRVRHPSMRRCRPSVESRRRRRLPGVPGNRRSGSSGRSGRLRQSLVDMKVTRDRLSCSRIGQRIIYKMASELRPSLPIQLMDRR